MLRIDCGRRLERVNGRPCVVETIALPAADASPAFGALTVWARAFPVYPNLKEQNR